MAIYEDVKRAIQDFTTPELREIKSKLAGFEELTAERFKRLEEKIAANHREVMTALNLDKRLSLLEDRQQRNEPTQH